MNPFRRLRSLFRRRQQEAEMAEEMRSHLRLRTAEHMADGMSADEAARAAQRNFGGVEQIKERCRDERRILWLEQSGQDIRYAFRQLRRNPGFAAAAIATLALGIGLNTAVFSVAYGVLWRPLPYPDSARLVMLTSAQQTETGPRTFSTWAPGVYAGLRQHATTLAHLAAYSSVNAPLTGRGEPLQLPGVEVSPDFFPALGVTPVLGRAFLTGAGAPEDDRSVIVSHRLWRTTLQADPAAIGQSLTIGGLPRTVIGVLPADFRFRPVVGGGELPPTDIFLPNRWAANAGGGASLFLLGRMKAGITRAGAEAELTTLVNNPSIAPGSGGGEMEGPRDARIPVRARVVGLQQFGTESARTLLLVLLGGVSFVLLIACVNVANLQMARLTARRGELSVRMALGAGRRRIMRQLLTEAVVLSLVGAALGVILAIGAIDVTLPLLPPSALPRLGEIAIDARVLAFCLGLSFVSTLLVGLVPALRMSRAAVGAGGARATGDRQGERTRSGLAAAQIAMTLVLLIGAGLLSHSFVRLMAVSPGFEASGRDGVVQTVTVTLPEGLYDRPDRIHAFARGLLERIQNLPGVTSASVVNFAPFRRPFIRDEFEIEGQPKPKLDAGRPRIEPGYFRTMGIPLLAGREFTDRDTAEAPKVVIVSERIVRDYFPDGPAAALGRRVRLGEREEWQTIVGVAAEIRQGGLDEDVQPMLYAPFQQGREAFLLRFVSFVVRTPIPAGTVEGIRTEIRRVAPDLPIVGTVTMDEAVAATVAQPRFRMLLLGLFATAATLIATCGLYGLMAYTVTQRRREIGVRMALGATGPDVIRLVLARALRIVAVGLVVGLAGAAVVTRVLQRFLFGVTPTDPIVFASVTLLLLAVALLAAWLPARRAAKVDPMVALRSE